MLVKRREAARQAAKERKSALILQQKRIEQAKDEVYDQLVKGGGSTTKSSDKMRKLKKVLQKLQLTSMNSMTTLTATKLSLKSSKTYSKT